MTTKRKASVPSPLTKKPGFKQARDNLERITKDIGPYVRPKKRIDHSTRGRWAATSAVLQQEPEPSQRQG